jgi:hypothetical protein
LRKVEIKKALNQALENYKEEIDSQLSSSSFSSEQKEELLRLMKNVFYTLSEFQTVIENLGE